MLDGVRHNTRVDSISVLVFLKKTVPAPKANSCAPGKTVGRPGIPSARKFDSTAADTDTRQNGDSGCSGGGPV
jgi:hypothetical protein